MKKLYIALLCCGLTFACFSQSTQRVAIARITPSENTGQDYSPWLNDNTDSLIADVWETNMKYIDVKLQLASKTLVSNLTFFDGAGVFTTNPAYIYALSGNQKIYLGKFEGTTYLTFVNLLLQNPILADAIIIHKYSNNIPQKVQIFGQPYVDSATTPEPTNRLYFSSATPTENTGQNYDQWLNDNLDSTIGWGTQNSFKYIDVTLKLQQRSNVKKFSFWDTESVFDDYPCYFYAVKDTTKTFLGTFTGPTFNTWVDLVLPQGVIADAILVHKFGRNIPQKINAYGEPLLTDPLDTIVPFNGRIKITSIVPAENTDQDYSSWLSDNLDSLVPNVSASANFKYTNVALALEKRSKVGRLSFYDYEGVFDTDPAYIYAKKGLELTLLGTFTGPSFKTFVDLAVPDSTLADSIIIRKYGNNIPQKILVFGRFSNTSSTPVGGDTTKPIVDTNTIVKIPIDGSRWYQLNNSTNGLQGLTDNITSQIVNTGYGRVLNNYDAYYPVKQGEKITLSKVKFYDGEGSLGDFPLTLSVITDSGVRITVGTFIGDRYNSWVGPYPSRGLMDTTQFKLDSTIRNIKYIVLNCWYQFPNEMELYGTYSAPPATTPFTKKPVKFNDVLGVNAYEWNFENPGFTMVINEGQMKAVKTFKGVRHYMDWQKLEPNEGGYTYSPTHAGSWSYDAIYERCKADGIEVLADLKTLPDWLKDTYPQGETDPENVPAAYGSNYSDPNSYIKQAKVGFQYMARYGANPNVPLNLLSVDASKRWPDDPANVVKVGLNLIKYIECDNERDKWWKGRKGYQTAYEYAANLSAFYDGNKNTMGPGVGVKNADSTVKVVMAGLASPNSDYVRGMIEWCRQYRGYKADGTVNLCWDIINYHLYSNDSRASQNGNPTRGVAPELSEADSVAASFLQVAHDYAQNMPVWITELGYDDNQGSPIKAIPIGSKTFADTKADWTLRSALLYARAGIEKAYFYQLYDDNASNPVQFGSSGLINQDTTRKPAADFLYQAGNLIGAYSYTETLNANPIVDKYELDGKPAYVLLVPDEVGRTANYELDLGSADSAKIYTPMAGRDTMTVQYVATVNGKLTLPVTETPIFVLPMGLSNNTVATNNHVSAMVATETAVVAKIAVPVDKRFNVYPNPAANEVTVNVSSNTENNTEINILNVTGVVVRAIKTGQGDGAITQSINLANLAAGVYWVQVKQGKSIQYKTFIKLNN